VKRPKNENTKKQKGKKTKSEGAKTELSRNDTRKGVNHTPTESGKYGK
jgi:hypothetical protein